MWRSRSLSIVASKGEEVEKGILNKGISLKCDYEMLWCINYEPLGGQIRQRIWGTGYNCQVLPIMNSCLLPRWTLIWVFKMLEIVKDCYNEENWKVFPLYELLSVVWEWKWSENFYLRMLKTNFMLLQMSLIMRQNCILSTSSRLKD